MFYVTILFCALIGAVTHGPIGVLAGAVIGFLIAKLDGYISSIGKTNDPEPNLIFIKRVTIAACIVLAHTMFEAVRRQI
ncbi:hypothetical protein [Enterobacter cloacae]|uniref:hypothetical protein n=1 Tax=Enterobacter cloacae TaxID=550 RepID=UPI003361A86E